MTMIAQQAEDRAVKIITGLDDIALVDTPVTYSTWSPNGWVDKVRHEPRACLFKLKDRTERRPATVVTCGAYGDPFVTTGRLVSVTVRKSSWRSPWELSVWIIEPGKRNSIGFNRDFPGDAVLLMWGKHDISLADLPPLTAPLRWHCKNFAAAWREVACRCHATGYVWLDTVAATIEDHAVRHVAQQADS
jgi:hypothetical protein